MGDGLRIGVDVGGTNTDAVLLRGSDVEASVKVPTTADVNGGIADALRALDADRGGQHVDAVIIGTTHFMNAVVQARELEPVAAVRLATPPQTLGPFVAWPRPLVDAVRGQAHLVAGGHQYTGTPLSPLDEPALVKAAHAIRAAGLTHVAISGVFSPVESSAEERAAEILTEELGDDHAIVCSSEIGRVGLLERENAAILNASLLPLAARVIDGFAELGASLGADTSVYLTQNDGTLMTLDAARRYPILTVSSGPTNSMRGAAFLSGEHDAVVVDIGGTTSDVGLLRHGFPRDSLVAIELAGVRTNFRIPDVNSIALGGGTRVGSGGAFGPTSVGHHITRDALVFGGETLTLTDLAVAAGLAEVGDAARVASVAIETVETTLAAVRARLINEIVAARVSPEPIPTLVVGGGAFLAQDLPGLDPPVLPPHSGVANAVGAALAQASGTIDSVYSLADSSREEALDAARRLAHERAIEAGAVADTVRIIDEEDVPLAHLPGGTATRVRVKAVGDLELGGHAS